MYYTWVYLDTAKLAFYYPSIRKHMPFFEWGVALSGGLLLAFSSLAHCFQRRSVYSSSSMVWVRNETKPLQILKRYFLLGHDNCSIFVVVQHFYQLP